MTRLLREYLKEPRPITIRIGCSDYYTAIEYMSTYKKTGTYKVPIKDSSLSKFDFYTEFQEEAVSYEDDFIESNIRCGEYTRTSLFI